jgi:hypothetical protein
VLVVVELLVLLVMLVVVEVLVVVELLVLIVVYFSELCGFKWIMQFKIWTLLSIYMSFLSINVVVL